MRSRRAIHGVLVKSTGPSYSLPIWRRMRDGILLFSRSHVGEGEGAKTTRRLTPRYVSIRRSALPGFFVEDHGVQIAAVMPASRKQ